MQRSLNSVPLHLWINYFLKERGLQTADKRSLYNYQMTQREYYELREQITLNRDAKLYYRNSAACAAFCLYCSEWYRREHTSSDRWKWEPIWKILKFRFNQTELSKIVPKGLEFWHRQVRHYNFGHRAFLGSLFCEGGLPFQVLKKPDNRFNLLFKKILHRYDEWKIYDDNIQEQVKSIIEKTIKLPQIFLQPSSIKLIADMADKLISLVDEYELNKKDNPAEYLDSVNRSWREIFPIPLDDATGTEFLNGLLQTTVSETRQRQKFTGDWQCEHYLKEQEQEFFSKVSFPHKIVFQVSEQTQAARFELYIFEQGEKIFDLGPGYATFKGSHAKVHLRYNHIKIKRKNFNSELTLVATAGGAIISKIAIKNSMLPIGEVPVGFDKDDDRWKFCGQASFTTASEDILLILPEDSNFSCENVEITDGSDIQSLPTKRLKGKADCRVVVGKDIFSIRSGRQGTNNNISLSGTTTDWLTKPVTTFIGLPKPVQGVGADSDASDDRDIFISGKSVQQCNPLEIFGTQYVSVRNANGESLLRRKVGILPPDFRIEILCGETPNKGIIRLHCSYRCLYSVLDKNIVCERQEGDNYVQLNLSCQSMPPSTFDLSVTLNLLAAPITIRLPFPANGSLLFDQNGKPLSNEFDISKLLPGARAWLMPGNQSVTNKYEFELSLHGSAKRHARYTWQHRASKKPVEIDLYSLKNEIANLMSLESGIDQKVELCIKAITYPKKESYLICRHTQEIELIKVLGKIMLRSAGKHKSPADNFHAQIILLHEPDRKPVEIPTLTTEDVSLLLEIPDEIQENGPWIIVPSPKSDVKFRPLFYVGTPPETHELTGSMQKAVLTFKPDDHKVPESDPDDAETLAEINELTEPVQETTASYFKSNIQENAFTPVLDEMSDDFLHSGWEYMRALYDNYKHLPLATFEAWKALIKHSSALAMCLFKFEMDVNLISKIESEFPVIWELLPVHDLQRACQQCKDALREKVTDEHINTKAKKMLSRLGEAVYSVGEGIQAFILGELLPKEFAFTLAQMQPLFKGWYQKLMRNHIVDDEDTRWPDFADKKFKSWYSDKKHNVLGFDPEVKYRCTVVYFPVFAAAVASGKCQLSDLFEDEAESIFFLRQIKDFDSAWFTSVYRYCLLNYFADNDMRLLNHG